MVRQRIVATGLAVALCTGAAHASEFFVNPEPEAFFLVLFLFALFGGVGRLLFMWNTTQPWQRHVGSLMLGVFGAWLVGLYLWGSIAPPALLAVSGSMAAIGGEVIERAARRFAKRAIGDGGIDPW